MTNKKEFLKEVILWTSLFVVFVLAPLFVAVIGHQEAYRGFWIEFGVALGFIGIAMMGLQFVLTARFKNVAAPIGTDSLLNFHRQAGYVAYFFILGHVIVLITADSEFLYFFDPGVNAPRAVALVSALIMLTMLVVFTIWREKLRIPYEWWRLSHGLFAFLIIFIGLSHMLMVGFYISELWQQVLWIFLVGFAMLLLIHIRVINPYKLSKKPYKTTGVWQEAKKTWTLEIEPDNHSGFDFLAGQFAWLTIGESPFSINQHPFSFSSSADVKGRYQFTIKELGDFTSSIKSIEAGTPIYMEGPYGAFTLNPEPREAFFVIGGIGITPVISMLRTLKDRNDNRKMTLIYGNPDTESIAFREELKELEQKLNFNVVHVVENPPDDWTGYEGFITEEILKTYIPEDVTGTDFYVCGPEPMMDMAEMTLRDWQVPVFKLKSERFNIV